MGKPYPIPEVPPLPKDRLREEPPFTVTGVDFTGALKVQKKNGHEGKVYICLFTCASTRAVHLELVTNLTEEQFILAFRRFSSRKSLPKIMISDNATTYVSSRKIKKLTSSHSLQETLNTHDTRWKFIPKRAPWYGGFWERLIGLTKNCLRKVLGRSFVNLDVLNTIIVEIECILNDRPLTYASAVPLDEDPLTPSHLLYGRKIKSFPYPGSSNEENVTTDLNHVSANETYNIQQKAIQHFLQRWRKEYLTSLREYHRSHGESKQNIQTGDIVQIFDEFNPRNLWKLAKIEELISGQDGRRLIRSVLLKTRNGITSRPITKLYPLELNSGDDNKPSIPTKDREAKLNAIKQISSHSK